MRALIAASLLACLTTSACATQSNHHQPSLALRAAGVASCDPATPEALVARPADGTKVVVSHTIVEPSALGLNNGKYVEGPCVREIVNYVAGQIILSAGASFVVRDDGRVELDPQKREPDRTGSKLDKVDGLGEYELLMDDRVLVSNTTAGQRETYVGLFRGKSEYLIARFDTLNGGTIGKPELLIRSSLPIVSIDYLPGPDYPGGQIGFVQPTGQSSAWLYAYDWTHGIFRT